MGDSDNKFPIIAVVVIVIIVLFWMLKPSKKEKYNAGNNIDFRKPKPIAIYPQA